MTKKQKMKEGGGSFYAASFFAPFRILHFVIVLAFFHRKEKKENLKSG